MTSRPSTPFTVTILVALMVGSAALSAQDLPSASVDHPAIAKQEKDYRLDKDPEEQAALAETLLQMDLETVLGMIETDNGLDWRFACFECGKGIEYTFENPNALTCSACGTTYDETNLPPTGVIEGSGPDGRQIVFRYHQRGRKKLFPAALMRNRRHAKLGEGARALGRRYVDTGNEAYAARAVAILDGLAKVFPKWPVIEVLAFPRPANFFIGPERPYDHWVHYKWRHTHNYDVPYDLTFAYDFIYNATAWDEQPGARVRVENDLLRAGYDQAWTTHEDMGRAVNNLTGTLIASTILLGRTLGEPEMIHRAVFTLQDMLRVFYHFDGMEYEGALTYHGTVTGRCAIAERMLEGYRDPEGYVDTTYSINLDDLNLREKIPVYGRAWKVWHTMQLPNGNPVCVHDTNFPTERAVMPADAPMPNIEMNAYGHLALGRGQGLTGMQSHLHACPFSRMGHYHDDKLSMILFGAGEELLSDIGYVHVGGKNRYFANSSISHNTVTVEYDGPKPRVELQDTDPSVVGTIERPKQTAAANRPEQDARSTLIAYDPGVSSDKRVQLVAMSSPGPPVLRLGRRTREHLMIALDDERSCLVDIFRIQGGKRHHFVLRPSADEDVTTESVSLSLSDELPGTLASPQVAYGQTPPEGQRNIPYSWLVHTLREAPAQTDWSLTWAGDNSGARLQVHMAGMNDAVMLLGQSPSLRRARNNDKNADEYQNPHLILQHPETGQGSTFAAVYEAVPPESSPLIRSVSFDTDGRSDMDAPVTVRIETANGTFTVDARCTPVSGAAQIAPSYRVAATRDGNPAWEWTRHWEGTPDEPRTRLKLAEVRRIQDGDAVNGLVVEGRVPADALMPGQWIRVVYGENQAYGYEIASVRAEGDKTLLEIAGEPGFQITDDGMRLLYYPFYETPGNCVVDIQTPQFTEQ